jgi:hypothetical protein
MDDGVDLLQMDPQEPGWTELHTGRDKYSEEEKPEQLDCLGNDLALKVGTTQQDVPDENPCSWRKYVRSTDSVVLVLCWIR